MLRAAGWGFWPENINLAIPFRCGSGKIWGVLYASRRMVINGARDLQTLTTACKFFAWVLQTHLS